MYKMKLLEYFWNDKANNIHNIFSLYFSINENDRKQNDMGSKNRKNA